MQRLALLPLALAIAVFVGCNTSDRGGKKDENTPGSETFTVKGPMTSTTIKQGDKQTVELKLNRGKEFKQDVALKAEAPTGLTVNLDPATVKASDKETVNASITAAKDAPVGEHKVKITATPAKGNATSLDVSVKVEAVKDK